MKINRILSFFLGLLVFFSVSSSALAYVSVNGYYKSNGTYVNSYVRSSPNALKYDNYSYKSYQPAYNSSYYTTTSISQKTPSYYTDPDYYTGKSIYDSYQPSSYSYTAPSYKSYSYSYPSYNSGSSYFKSYNSYGY